MSEITECKAACASAVAAGAPGLAVGGPDHHGEAPRLGRVLNVVPTANNDRLGLQEAFQLFEGKGFYKGCHVTS